MSATSVPPSGASTGTPARRPSVVLARAGDLLGRRRVFITGVTVFTGASLLGGLAPTAELLLAARVLQGIGGAIAAPAALTLLMLTFKEGPERLKALGLYSLVSSGGASVGRASSTSRAH